jgi:hypothetical protein
MGQGPSGSGREARVLIFESRPTDPSAHGFPGTQAKARPAPVKNKGVNRLRVTP